MICISQGCSTQGKITSRYFNLAFGTLRLYLAITSYCLGLLLLIKRIIRQNLANDIDLLTFVQFYNKLGKKRCAELILNKNFGKYSFFPGLASLNLFFSQQNFKVDYFYFKVWSILIRVNIGRGGDVVRKRLWLNMSNALQIKWTIFGSAQKIKKLCSWSTLVRQLSAWVIKYYIL